MKYKVLTYGNPMLREKSRRITSVDAGIRKLADDMLETMHDANGVGLAAQQVGRTEAICVIDVPGTLSSGQPRPQESEPAVQMPLVMINPRIQKSEGETVCEEGCLSFPEVFVPISRPEFVTVQFGDLEGRTCVVRATGLLGRAIQHELDHLHGKLLVDRMDALRKIELGELLERLRSTGRKQASGAAPQSRE